MGIWEEDCYKISGAGVLVVEDYFHRDGTIIPCILVGKNKAAQTLNDFGGAHAVYHESIAYTAHSELLEESCGLIDVDPSLIVDLPHVTIGGSRDTHYRAYILKAEGVASKHYDTNRKILAREGAKKQWLETESIHHIPIENIDFDTLTERGAVLLADIHGGEIKCEMRLRKILFEAKDVVNDVVLEDAFIDRNDLHVEGGKYRFKRLKG